MNLATRSFISAVIAADLLAIVYFGGTYMLTGSMLPHHEETKIIVAGAEDTSAAAGAPKAAEPAFDAASYVANVENGMKISAKCKACHTFEQGGADRTGPNLWGIVGADVTHKAGYAYSSAMVAEKAKIGKWDKEHLNAYLENPKEYVPGTKMQFNGVKKPAERADLIAWLETLK